MNCIRRIISLIICISVVIGSTFISSSVNFSQVYAEESTGEVFESIESQVLREEKHCAMATEGITVSLETEARRFISGEDIVVSYLVSDDEEIMNFQYAQTGFSVVDIYVDENNCSRIVLELSLIPEQSEYCMELCITLADKDLEVCLYAIENECGIFISQYSEENAYERYLEYAVMEGEMTFEEAELLWNGNFDNSNEIVPDIESPLLNEDESGIALTSIFDSDSCKVSGYLKWKDDDTVGESIHALRRVKVNVYYENSWGINCWLATTYTDKNGHFSVNIPARNNVFVRVFPGDGNVMVRSPILGMDYSIEYIVGDIEAGEEKEIIPEPITMADACGQAFQISQALLTARDYAWIRMGYMPVNLTLLYPFDSSNSYYIPGLSCIIIKGTASGAYNTSWDTVMHEYGHHIELFLGIMKDPYVDKHYSTDNHANNIGIEKGTRLAWGESWNTVFGLMAQDYYKSYLSDIYTVCDTCYTSSSKTLGSDIETTGLKLGEACERSVMAVLWDLYDGNNDGADEIELGHEAYWKLTTEALKYRFSDRANRFYELYADQPEMIRKFANNLTFYKMAPSKPVITNLSSVSLNVAPILTWSKQGGSSSYPNNSFDIIVYDESYNEILRIDDIYGSEDSNTSYTYSIDNTAWKNALEGHGYNCDANNQLYITVSGSRVEPSVITGPYYSEYEELPITHEYTYSSVNAATHNRYCSGCGTTTVQPHRFVYSKFNDAMHFARCADCGYFQFMSHNMVYEQVDGRYHEHHCSYCSHSEGNSLHVLKSNGSTNRYQNCTACGALVDTGINMFPTIKNKIEEEEYTE